MPVVTIARLLGSRGDEIGRASTVSTTATSIIVCCWTTSASLARSRRTRPRSLRLALILGAPQRGAPSACRGALRGVRLREGRRCCHRRIGRQLPDARYEPCPPSDHPGADGGPGPARHRPPRRGKLDLNSATEVVRRSDRERIGYVRYMNNADLMDIHNYDLVVNTAVLSIDQAIKLIAYTLKRAEIGPTATSLEAIDNLALAARVEAVLISNAGIWIHQPQGDRRARCRDPGRRGHHRRGPRSEDIEGAASRAFGPS